MTITEDPELVAQMAARDQQVQDAMQAAGVNVIDHVQEDYFAFDDEENVTLPDGITFVTIRALNEGARKKYMNNQNREITVERVTQNMKLKVESGEERHSLLEQAIVGWNLIARDKDGKTQQQACSKAAIQSFLRTANPKIVDIIDKAVRKQNPWLRQQMTVEDIDTQIAELQELRETLEKDEAGKDS